MKKALVLLVLFFAITGCLFANGEKEASKAPEKLVFCVQNTTNYEPYEQMFAEYTAQTGIEVEIQVLPAGEEYGRLLQTRFATNDYPDAFEMNPGTKQYTKFGVSKLYDWTNDTTIYENMLPAAKEFQIYKGKIYGVPYSGVSGYGVFYNKKVFAAVGEGTPKNYDDFIRILQKLKAAGYTPIYEAAKSEWPLQVYTFISWPSLIDPTLADGDVAKLNNNAIRLTEIPALREVLENYLDLFDMGLVNENWRSGTYEEEMELLGDGKVACACLISGAIPAMVEMFGKDKFNETIGFFPMPGKDDEGIAMLTPASQILVPNSSVNPNAEYAADLVRFMVKIENQNKWYKVNGGIPTYAGVTSTLLPIEKTIQDYDKAGKAVVNIQNRLESSFTDFPKILQKMLNDHDVSSALVQIDENYRKTGNARAIEGF